MPDAQCIQILGDRVEWTVSFLPEQSTAEFVHGLFANQRLVIGNREHKVAMEVVDVEIQPRINFVGKQLFRTLSPICVRTKEGGRTQYLSPKAPQYSQALLTGLLSRYHAINGKEYVGDIFIDFKLLNEPKSKLIAIKSGSKMETKVRGFDFIFTLTLPEPLMRIAYEAGLGEETGIGFGMIENC